MKSKFKILVVVWVLVLSLGACNEPGVPPTSLTDPTTVPATAVPEIQATPTADVSRSGDGAYPGPATMATVTVDFGSYPVPQVSERIHPRTQYPDGPLAIPAAKAETGVVRGRLKADSATEMILFTGDVYLAPVVYMVGEIKVPFLSLDESQDPKASLRSSDNEFVIVDVPPGEYGVIIHTPVSDHVVPDAEYGFLIIEVVAGKVVDVGDLTVE